MTIEQLRDLYRASPFQPFTIHLADGETIPVPCAELLSFSPSGRTIIVFLHDETFKILDLARVTRLEVDSAGTPTTQQS
jgi:hypothetical protein